MSRDQRAGGPLLGKATKTIGSLIGAGREAYAHHKAKSAQEEQAKAQQASPDDHGAHDELDQQLDEEDWALDEASTELAPDEKQSPHATLLETPGLEIPATPLRPLQYPVILPQRRPQTKSRGFVRAYAPLLGECKGIDEQTFLKFLDEFYESTQTSNYLQAINIAGNVVGMVPSVIAMAIATATNIATKTAISAQGRYKTNTYLDAINTKLFNPRNLHCVVMTFRPDSNQKFVDVDMTATNDALQKNMNHASKMGKMANTAGTSKGEFTIPQAAPLIYPAIDAVALTAAANNQPLPAQKQNSLKRSTAFMKDYLDRRAAAEYAGVHGTDSKLALPGATEQNFVSRYSDPNHPANSGSILALLTGGAVDPRAKILGRRAEMHAKVTRSTLSEQDRHNIAMGRGGPKKTAGIRGVMRKVVSEDVLYLLIAEIPSQEEMGRLREIEEGGGRMG